MESLSLTEPAYTQPEVLSITKLEPSVLQTWVNRRAIELSEQNPGSGRRRLYSKLDIVKLAIMRRMADFDVALARSVELATAAAATLAAGQSFDWNFYIALRPKAATAKGLSLEVSHFPDDGFANYSPVVGDPRCMFVSDFVMPWGDRERRDRKPLTDVVHDHHTGPDSDFPKINEERRAQFARGGIHAEPVLIIPLGEIVNGTLLQLQALDDMEGGA